MHTLLWLHAYVFVQEVVPNAMHSSSASSLRKNKLSMSINLLPVACFCIITIVLLYRSALFSSYADHIFILAKDRQSLGGSRLFSPYRHRISQICDYGKGEWQLDPSRKPLYSEECPFHRNAWNCRRNRRPRMEEIFQWRWSPKHCNLSVVNPHLFLNSVRDMRIGFIGDSLNENLVVSLLCILWTADNGARKWKRKGAWRGAYFPKFNVTIGYHRAVLLARYYEVQIESLGAHVQNRKLQKAFRVDVDVPASDWINVTEFYDIFVFNTGHWWTTDKFPMDAPLFFYKHGKLMVPLLDLKTGLKEVLRNMIPYLENNIPPQALKIWRTQSPRHFEGGEWNQNGSCMSNQLLLDSQINEWFKPELGGVNRDSEEVNAIAKEAVLNRSFYFWDVTRLSEYRADAHPAIWLGRQDAHKIWGQDCMHWCLPGVPDTWVDMLVSIVQEYTKLGSLG